MVAIRPPLPSSERLAVLYRLSHTFNSSLDLHEVLNRVMDEVIEVMHAERGFVMLRDAGNRLSFRIARGMDRQTIDDPEFQVSRSVVEQVAREGRAISTSDAQTDGRFSMRHSVRILGLRSILCVPLQTRDQVSGVIYVDNRMRAGIFTQADLDLLLAIASSAAVAIENARLYQVAVEKGRLERELQMAHEVQASFLPREVPQIPGWEFAARWHPAREVAGDYYDFISSSGGHLGLVIADVADKGMPAALFMVLTRSTIRAGVSRAPLPADGIGHVNRLLSADATGGMFVTLFYADLDPASGEMTYVNAGHNPPLLYHAGSGQLTELGRTGMALGVLVDAPFEQRTVRLESGDLIVLYTDGVTDAIDARERAFGMERLRRVVLDHRSAPAAEIVTALDRAISDFVGSSAPFDDVAIVVAKRL